jgi:hypothetical protein
MVFGRSFVALAPMKLLMQFFYECCAASVFQPFQSRHKVFLTDAEFAMLRLGRLRLARFMGVQKRHQGL